MSSKLEHDAVFSLTSTLFQGGSNNKQISREPEVGHSVPITLTSTQIQGCSNQDTVCNHCQTTWQARNTLTFKLKWVQQLVEQ